MPSLEFNDSAASAAILRIQRGMADMRPVMDDLGELLAETTKQRFTAGAAPDGTPWAPKSKATLAAYEHRGDRVDARPLFGPSGILSSQIFHQATSDGVSWGSGQVYAAMMQFGGTKDAFPNLWGDIPARPFLGLSETDRADIIDTVAEWIDSLGEASA